MLPSPPGRRSGSSGCNYGQGRKAGNGTQVRTQPTPEASPQPPRVTAEPRQPHPGPPPPPAATATARKRREGPGRPYLSPACRQYATMAAAAPLPARSAPAEGERPQGCALANQRAGVIPSTNQNLNYLREARQWQLPRFSSSHKRSPRTATNQRAGCGTRLPEGSCVPRLLLRSGHGRRVRFGTSHRRVSPRSPGTGCLGKIWGPPCSGKMQVRAAGTCPGSGSDQRFDW